MENQSIIINYRLHATALYDYNCHAKLGSRFGPKRYFDVLCESTEFFCSFSLRNGIRSNPRRKASLLR